MASSRIFVRGLPPTFTEDEFRKHFSKQQSVTDAKLFPHRRIGYVGYRTADDAAKAVKYFNKSFIRMSRIAVELARPVDDKSLLILRHQEQSKSSEKQTNSTNARAAEAGLNPLKRKRTVADNGEEDPKLKEFLHIMQAPSKSRTWVNEDVVNAVEAVDTSAVNVPGRPVEDAESDAEYQTVSRKPKSKRPESRVDAQDNLLPAGNTASENVDPSSTRPVGGHDPELVNEPDSAATVGGGGMSDADWLRSRTSRLLGLADEEQVESDAVVRSEDNGVEGLSAEAGRESDAPDIPTLKAQEPGEKLDGQADEPTAAIQQSGRLFVRNLPYNVTEDDLREHFKDTGSLDEVHVPIDTVSGSGKGFAYVQYNDPDSAVKARESLDGTIFQGRLMHILPAASKREPKIDDVALSKLPVKKQKQIQRKAEAASSTFNWNSLYMNADAVMSSISERLGVSKSELLDPTASDAAVKQAHAETHIIQETKAYFAENGVDLEAFKRRERGDKAILVKNFPYGTKSDELRKMFEEHGQVVRFLMPPNGTIAIAEFAQAPQARSAFGALAYRKMKDSILFLEKAPKDVFSGKSQPSSASSIVAQPNAAEAKLSTTDLLQQSDAPETADTSTLFIRNLNFTTTTRRLTEVFKPLGGFLSARVKTKTDPKRPGEVLSMGFGFLEFRTKEQAQAALKAMDGYNLDGYKLLIKASHKGLDAAEERRKEDNAKKAASRKAKIVVKNLPFEASKKDVRALLGPYGQLRSVRVPKKFDNSTRGFAFAEFATAREAENAMDALRDTHLLGRRLVLDFAAEDPADAEEELEKMQQKVGSQVNKVALQRLTGGGRKKFNVAGDDQLEEA